MMNFKFLGNTISFENYYKQDAEYGIPEMYLTDDFIVVSPEGREIDADYFINSLPDKAFFQFYKDMDNAIRNYLYYYSSPVHFEVD